MPRLALTVCLAVMPIHSLCASPPRTIQRDQLGRDVKLRILVDKVMQPKLAAVDPQRASAEKERLLTMLPQDRRARIVAFEQHMDWVRQYLNASADFDAGAAVTYFLADMGSSVSVMPAMYAEVRSMNEEMRRIDGEIHAMNTKMQSLPVLTTAVQAMTGFMEEAVMIPCMVTRVMTSSMGKTV